MPGELPLLPDRPAKPPAASPASLPPDPGIVMLVALSSLQPFALNSLAPATPAMARTLGESYAAIQLTLSIYLVAVALAQLIVGPLSDRYGRRPCVIGAILFFLAGSALGLAATDLATLIAARGLQAAGAGTTFALVRAIIRDTSTPNQTASRIGYVTMAMMVVPMVSPLLGAWLETGFGWRSIFVAMSLLGLCILAFIYPRLAETAPARARDASLLDTFRAAPMLLKDRNFLVTSFVLAMTSACFFSFIAAAPWLVVEHMGQTAQSYSLWFMINALGYMLGNFLTGRLSGRFGAARLTLIGLLISLAALSVSFVAPFTSWWSPAALFIPLMFNAVGNGLSVPTATASGLSVRPDLAGSAAGFMGALQLGFGALSAIILSSAVILWPPALTTAIFGFTIAALAAIWINSRL
jgi:DHA1 family bicyclomycin/chloramphenicol resistance-like MFS transporter